jgi:hypothetical protein
MQHKLNRSAISKYRENKAFFAEKKNPLLRISKLINQFHSIDLMYATYEEKEWAKKRLRFNILKISEGLNESMRSIIRISLNNKQYWENIRENLI